MVTLNDALLEHVKARTVAAEEAYMKAVDKAGFEALLKRHNIDTRFVLPATGGPTSKP
jgi:twitching motility protein PilT